VAALPANDGRDIIHQVIENGAGGET
jgi:hypothetical protein